ncbi:MAG: hypothetical protein K6G81_06395 [Lachnospiraceae bacterium]|nr:hypothetical protein [Lachnospiraceae bacterium]
MREKLYRFMQGRYGIDAFGKFLIYTGLILALVNMLFRTVVFSFLSLLIWIYAYFRIFSRNYSRRSDENSAYLRIKERIANTFRKLFPGLKTHGPIGSGTQERAGCSSRCNSYSGQVFDEQYRIFKCPSCKQKLRVPKGRGKIRITCRRCGNEFVKKS